MKMGDLKEAWKDRTCSEPSNEDVIARARRSFGHIEGRSDEDLICLLVSCLDRHKRELLAENDRMRVKLGLARRFSKNEE